MDSVLLFLIVSLIMFPHTLQAGAPGALCLIIAFGCGIVPTYFDYTKWKQAQAGILRNALRPGFCAMPVAMVTKHSGRKIK